MATGADNTNPPQETTTHTDVVPAADTTVTKKGNRSQGILSVLLKAKQQGQNTEWKIEKVLRVKEGRYKHNFANITPGYLKAYFTDDAGNKLDSSYFDHPLKKRMESPGDNGQPATAIVNLSEGTAYLRADNNTAISMLLIYSADNKMITSFRLNEY